MARLVSRDTRARSRAAFALPPRTPKPLCLSAMVVGLIARQPIVRFIDDGGTKLAGHRQVTALASEVGNAPASGT
jgi:hypothetical protein